MDGCLHVVYHYSFITTKSHSGNWQKANDAIYPRLCHVIVRIAVAGGFPKGTFYVWRYECYVLSVVCGDL